LRYVRSMTAHWPLGLAQIMQLQRKSGMTGRTAASGCSREQRRWAVQTQWINPQHRLCKCGFLRLAVADVDCSSGNPMLGCFSDRIRATDSQTSHLRHRWFGTQCWRSLRVVSGRCNHPQSCFRISLGRQLGLVRVGIDQVCRRSEPPLGLKQ